MTKLAMFNQLKSLAFGLDSLFKSTGQTQVKFHQVSAAVFIAVAKKLEKFEQNYSQYLYFAARFNRYDCVALLIKYGANVNAKNISDDTALECAITHQHWEIAKQLIQAGAVNRVDEKGKSILALIKSEEKRAEIQSWFEMYQMSSNLEECTKLPKNVLSNNVTSMWKTEASTENVLQTDLAESKGFK